MKQTKTRFLALWAAFFALAMSWVAMTPLGGSPDEPNHVVQAAAVVRGQLQDPVPGVQQEGVRHSWELDWKIVELPAVYAQIQDLPTCFAFRADVPADCQKPLPDEPGPDTPMATSAGRYNPLFYALVGWPSYLPDAATAIYGMRVLAAAWTSLFFAWAFRAFDRITTSRALRFGVLVTLTPGMFFLGGSVNPNGLETGAALSLWASMLALLFAPGRDPQNPTSAPARPNELFTQVGVSALVLCSMRPISPVSAAMIVPLCLLIASRQRIVALLRQRGFLITVGFAVLTVVWVLGWMATRPHAAAALEPVLTFENLKVALVSVFYLLDDYWQQGIGEFGWLDTPAPPFTLAMMAALLGFVALFALAAAPKDAAQVGNGGALRAPRWRLGLALLLVAFVVAPLVVAGPFVVDHKLLWQGRYAHSLYVGVGALLGIALAWAATSGTQHALVVRRVVNRAIPWGVLLFIAAYGAAFWATAIRWDTGVGFTIIPAWDYLARIVFGVVATTAVCAVVFGMRKPKHAAPSLPQEVPNDRQP